MPTNPLPARHSPGQSYLVSGAHLNRQNEALNAINSGHVIQRGASGINAAGVKANIPSPPFIFGIATITDRGNDCPQADEVPVGNDDFGRGYPCRDRNHYLCDFIYYNSDTGNYEKYGDELWLDAAGYYEETDSLASAPSSGPGYGPIPVYAKGDKTPAYLDVLRNRIIPVQSPYCDPPHAVYYNRDNATLITSEQEQQSSQDAPVSDVAAVEFYIEQSRPGIDGGDFRVVGTISFPLVKYPHGTSYCSSATFNTVPSPHGSLFRIRRVVGKNDNDYTVKAYWQRLRFTGLGRRSPDVVAASVVEPSIRGGDYTFDWTVDEDTIHRFKDAPFFRNIASDQGSQPGLIQVRYLDEKDEWQIGVEFHVCIQIDNDSEDDSGCCECATFQTAFGHLKSISVAVGDILEQGDAIGLVGDLGDQGDPHLHYEGRFGATADNFTVANDPTNGQSFNIDSVQVFPKIGVRKAGTAPDAAQGTAAQISYAKSKMTIHPVDDGHCRWEEHMGSAQHDHAKYYAKDLYCTDDSQDGATVRNFVDGLTVVIAIDQDYGGVLLEHFCDDCVVFKNESGETIPANGVMRIINGESKGQRTVYTVGKPNGTFQRFYLVNGDTAVGNGKYGCGKWLDEAGMVLFDDTDQNNPSVGKSYGAKSGSWKLWQYRPGFTFMGGVIDAGAATARFSAIQYQVNNLKAKADGDLTKGVVGTANVWMRNSATGAWEKSEYVLTDKVRPLGSDLAPDLYISLEWDCGEWSAGCLEN